MQESRNVSVSDFLDRVIHSRNLSLAQFAKSTISRVIQEQISLVNITTCRVLLEELMRAFPNDPGLNQIAAALANEEIRRKRLPVRPAKFPRDVGSRERSSGLVSRLLNEKKYKDVSTNRRVVRDCFLFSPSSSSSSRENNDDLRVSRRSLKDRKWTLSSSSSDEDERLRPHEIKKLREWHKRRYFWLWKRNSQAVRIFHSLSTTINRVKARQFLNHLCCSVKAHRLRESQTDESSILVALSRELKLKERYYDIWRTVFEHRMDVRRAQVAGVTRLFRSFSILRERTLLETFRCISIFTQNTYRQDAVRRFRKIIRRKLVGKFADFKNNVSVKEIARELQRVKLKAGLAGLEKTVKNRVSIELKNSFSKFKLIQSNNARRNEARKLAFRAWRIGWRQRTGLRKIKSVLDQKNSRIGLQGLKNHAFSGRSILKGLKRVNDVVLRVRMKPVFEKIRENSVKKRKINRFESLLRKKFVLHGLSKLKERPSVKKMAAVNTLVSFHKSKERLEKLRALHKLRENRSERSSLERKVWNKWVLAVKKRKICNKLIQLCRNVSDSQCMQFFSRLRSANFAFNFQKYRIEKMISASRSLLHCRVLKPSFKALTFDTHMRNRSAEDLRKRVFNGSMGNAFMVWKKRYETKLLLKRLVLRLTLKFTRYGFHTIEKFAYRSELLCALDECDQWRVVSEERKILISNLIDRFTIKTSLVVARNIFANWAQIVKLRKDGIKRMVRSVTLPVHRFFFSALKSSSSPCHYIIAGFAKISLVISNQRIRLLAFSILQLERCNHQQSIFLLERVSRDDLSQHEAVMHDMEQAALELQADYTALASRFKKLNDRNEVIENELVVNASKLEHEVKENEMLLLKVNDLKNVESERRIELDRILMEKRDLMDKSKNMDLLKSTIENQTEEIDMLKSKLNEYVKLSTSIQFYKNKVSLQSEQIASLQSKLREPAHPEDVLFSSPIHSRSEDITYASSSLRGLQQAVDRSNLLRSTRRSNLDMSQISGDSSRRRRDLPRR